MHFKEQDLFLSRRLQRLSNNLYERIINFLSKQTKIEEQILHGFKEFYFGLYDMDRIPPEFFTCDEYKYVFLRWFVFNWMPPHLAGVTYGDYFFFMEEDCLSAEQRELLIKLRDSEFSFFEILTIRKKRGIEVYDLIIKRKFQVIDRTVPDYLSVGDCAYGRVINFDNICYFDGFSPFIFDKNQGKEIANIDFISQFELSNYTDNDKLHMVEIDLREIYVSMQKALLDLMQ